MAYQRVVWLGSFVYGGTYRWPVDIRNDTAPPTRPPGPRRFPLVSALQQSSSMVTVLWRTVLDVLLSACGRVAGGDRFGRSKSVEAPIPLRVLPGGNQKRLAQWALVTRGICRLSVEVCLDRANNFVEGLTLSGTTIWMHFDVGNRPVGHEARQRAFYTSAWS